jgi:hypothetical protein
LDYRAISTQKRSIADRIPEAGPFEALTISEKAILPNVAEST